MDGEQGNAAPEARLHLRLSSTVLEVETPFKTKEELRDNVKQVVCSNKGVVRKFLCRIKSIWDLQDWNRIFFLVQVFYTEPSQRLDSAQMTPSNDERRWGTDVDNLVKSALDGLFEGLNEIGKEKELWKCPEDKAHTSCSVNDSQVVSLSVKKVLHRGNEQGQKCLLLLLIPFYSLPSKHSEREEGKPCDRNGSPPPPPPP